MLGFIVILIILIIAACMSRDKCNCWTGGTPSEFGNCIKCGGKMKRDKYGNRVNYTKQQTIIKEDVKEDPEPLYVPKEWVS